MWRNGTTCRSAHTPLGRMDEFSSPTRVSHGPGGIVYGIFWLSAEVMPDARLKQRGFLPVHRPNFDPSNRMSFWPNRLNGDNDTAKVVSPAVYGPCRRTTGVR